MPSSQITPLDAIDQKLMLAFEGYSLPDGVRSIVQKRPVGGFTLFRGLNVDTVSQIRELTNDLQSAASDKFELPLLIATDQEGGQFLALGEETTQFAGNMALGATHDPDLVERVGGALGRELRALGVNINYAPVCDLNTNPGNPSLGIRAFSDQPALTAQMAAALVRGLQSEGVAATLKHFPGKGEAALDSHYHLPRIDHDRTCLESREMVPFRAAMDDGAKLVMTGHFAIPALTGADDLPATLSRRVMTDYLRGEMDFEGVVITDALDMKAITQGAGQIIDVIAATRAGVDLMLLTKDMVVQERIYQGLQLAFSRGLITARDLIPSAGRIMNLKTWLAEFPQPDMSVVGCAEHRHLARQVARKSLTLLRDKEGLLPVKLAQRDRILAIMPQPVDLTPADTSSFVEPTLAKSFRRYHPNVDEIILPHNPQENDIRALREQAQPYDLIILGTINAHLNKHQSEMASQVLKLGVPTVTVALRSPYDLLAYPAANTHICTYSILEPSMQALAEACFEEIQIEGKLPVQIPDLHPFGYHWEV